MSSSGEMIVKLELVTPKKTAEAFWKLLPVISTREPSGPLVGEIRRISGRVVCAIATAHKIEAIVAIANRFPVFIPAASTVRTPAPTLSNGTCMLLA